MLRTDFSTNSNCAPNFIQNTDILITLREYDCRKQKLECAYNNIESRFPKPCFFFQLWYK